jgi:hypothetical protein
MSGKQPRSILVSQSEVPRRLKRETEVNLTKRRDDPRQMWHVFWHLGSSRRCLRRHLARYDAMKCTAEFADVSEELRLTSIAVGDIVSQKSQSGA